MSRDAATDAPRRGRVAAVLASRGLAWGLAGVLLLAALAAGGWAYTMWSRQQTEEAVLSRAEAVAEQVTSFEGATIDQWVSETQALATGTYAQQVEGLFNEQLRQSLRENEVQSTGEIDEAYLQSLDGDRASVFVVASQQSTNALRQEPIEDQLRMEITMERVDGQWLASNVAVLGPAQAGPAGSGGAQPDGSDGASSGADDSGQPGGASGDGTSSGSQ